MESGNEIHRDPRAVGEGGERGRREGSPPSPHLSCRKGSPNGHGQVATRFTRTRAVDCADRDRPTDNPVAPLAPAPACRRGHHPGHVHLGRCCLDLGRAAQTGARRRWPSDSRLPSDDQLRGSRHGFLHRGALAWVYVVSRLGPRPRQGEYGASFRPGTRGRPPDSAPAHSAPVVRRERAVARRDLERDPLRGLLRLAATGDCVRRREHGPRNASDPPYLRRDLRLAPPRSTRTLLPQLHCRQRHHPPPHPPPLPRAHPRHPPLRRRVVPAPGRAGGPPAHPPPPPRPLPRLRVRPARRVRDAVPGVRVPAARGTGFPPVSARGRPPRRSSVATSISSRGQLQIRAPNAVSGPRGPSENSPVTLVRERRITPAAGPRSSRVPGCERGAAALCRSSTGPR